MKSRLPLALLAGLLGATVGAAQTGAPMHIVNFDRNVNIPQSITKRGNKDRNSGGNRVSQKKRRIHARRAGY